MSLNRRDRVRIVRVRGWLELLKSMLGCADAHSEGVSLVPYLSSKSRNCVWYNLYFVVYVNFLAPVM